MNATELRAFLRDRYDDTELRQLAFDLNIPFEDLGGADIGKQARIQALIEWCVRRDRLEDLERAAVGARENVTMNDMSDGRANGAWGPAVQLERLTRGMDQLIRDVANQDKKIDLMAQRMDGFKERLDGLDERFVQLEKRYTTQPVSWQSWAGAGALLVAIVLLVLQVMK
jgi:hypothetical protein